MNLQPRPMPAIRVTDAFDHPDWVYELRHDGFRALTHVDGHRCTLESRHRHVCKHFPQLQVEIAHAIGAHSAVLDGEIVCRARRTVAVQSAAVPSRLAALRRLRCALGRRRRAAGRAARRAQAPIAERSYRGSRRGSSTWIRSWAADQTCSPRSAHAPEGVIAKWKRGRYHSEGLTTSWLKVRNPAYSQMQGRPELFGARRVGARSKSAKPMLCTELQALQRAL
jgi:ATP-dependent DNA ligase